MKKNSNRLSRINDEILREMAQIIRSELKDPRLNNLIQDIPLETVCSVTKVDTTSDLKICKIYVSILGEDDRKKKVMEALKSASGYIRKLIAERINLRNTPEFKFVLDDSLEYSMKISRLIDQVRSEPGEE